MTRKKLKKTAVFIVLICLFSCSEKSKEITITGQTVGSIPEKIEYTTPINGTWFFGAKNSVIPDSLGNFKIVMKPENASFITLYVPKKAAAVMLVEPGNNYEIEFHLNSKDQKIKIKGETSQAHTQYNLFPHPDFFVLYTSNELLKDSIFSSVSTKINALKEKEIGQFKEQLKKQHISKEFYDLATIDRSSYYAALETSIALIHNKNQTLSTEPENTEVTKFLEKTLKQTPTDSFNIRSPWTYTIMRNYIDYYQYKTAAINPDVTENIIDKENHIYKIKEAKKYLNDAALEYYYANYILSNSFNNKENSEDLITLFQNFKQEYPTSEYTQYVSPYIAPIIEFHEKIAYTNSNKNSKLVKDYRNISNFKELISRFKGQKVFVDIWGTWCAPCKKEFQQKDQYADLLKSKNITSLYICEGKISKEKTWKEMINYYDLEGYHLQANKALMADIISVFGKNGSFYYPRYVLINENGIVVNNEASYPSKTIEFEKELNENYDW